jgi:hypothetical protein
MRLLSPWASIWRSTAQNMSSVFLTEGSPFIAPNVGKLLLKAFGKRSFASSRLGDNFRLIPEGNGPRSLRWLNREPLAPCDGGPPPLVCKIAQSMMDQGFVAVCSLKTQDTIECLHPGLFTWEQLRCFARLIVDNIDAILAENREKEHPAFTGPPRAGIDPSSPHSAEKRHALTWIQANLWIWTRKSPNNGGLTAEMFFGPLDAAFAAKDSVEECIGECLAHH